MNQGDCNEPELNEVAKELHAVEHKLAEALVEEQRAEAKVESAEQQLEKIEEQLARESKVKVNGRTREVAGDVVSYEELVKLAFPNGPTKPDTIYTITYRNAADVPASGELDAGQSIKVKRGCNQLDETIINVTETIRS